MSETHVMVDIETLGLSVNSVILSIGAVVFDPVKGLGEEFYKEINPKQAGRTIDPLTVKWWMEQSTKCPINGTQSIDTVLQDFYDYLYAMQEGESELIIWANGTNFDISIIEHAHRQMFALKFPWKYNNVRDFRTISKLFGDYGNIPETVAAHNALEDAKWQAKRLMSILDNMKEHIDAIRF